MMIPNRNAREVLSSGVGGSAAFGISQADTSHIMGILRDTLYSDKVLAVLREYGSNAWDAHREAKKKDVPIKVQLPTNMDPTLVIRDYGLGLSHEQVFEVYTQYGASTKRNSDDAVGMLGIGCLLAGQPIVTVNGVKPIEEIKVGDLVLTHRNRFRKVTEIMRRPHKGPAYKVWLSQLPTPLILTANHPILVSGSAGTHTFAWVRPGEIKTGYRSEKKGIEAWNSYAVLPATLEQTENEIRVADFLGPTYSYTNGECTKTTVFRNSRSGVEHEADSTRVTSWPDFPETLPLNEEIGWLLGLYAAEGSATQKQVTISLNISETDLAMRFTQGMLEWFGIEFKSYPRPDRTLLELVSHHTALAALLGNLCGYGSGNKHVPAPVMQGNNAARRGFLRGVLDGDGSSTRPRFIFGVSSPNLAWGVRTLMAVTEDKWGSVGTMEDYPNRWSINYNREAGWAYSMRKGEYLLRPIKKTEAFELEAEVFNFSVQDDESYVSDFILHNSKSGFAYSDSFAVTSWNGGKKRMYVAVLDKSEKGEIKLLHEADCGDETGVEIQLAVRQEDVWEFTEKAKKLYRYFLPQPDINVALQPLPSVKLRLKHGALFDEGVNTYSSTPVEWTAIMGCVPYRVNLAQLQGQKQEIANYLNRISGTLYFEIGEVQVSASREELKYSAGTKAALIKKFELLIEEYVEHTLEMLESGGFTAWEKRIRAQVMGKLRLPIPKEFKSLVESNVSFKGTAPILFTVTKLGSSVSSVDITDNARFVLRDDERAIAGYNLGYNDYLVRPIDGLNPDLVAVQDELEEVLKKSGLFGMPTVMLSTLPWLAPGRNGQRKFNKKHHVKTFKLRIDRLNAHPLSERWEIETRSPTAKDLFVILDGFKTKDYDIYKLYKSDELLASIFNEEMPPIYGYKTTSQKPLSPTSPSLVGTHYKEARVYFAASIMAMPKVKQHLLDWYWSRVLPAYYPIGVCGASTERLRDLLAEDHPIKVLLKNRRKGAKVVSKLNKDMIFALTMLVDTTKDLEEKAAPKMLLDSIYKKYPLLALPNVAIDVLWGNHNVEWLEYVKLIDRTFTPTKDTKGVIHD